MSARQWFPAEAGLRAGARHLFISAVVALIPMGVIFFVWYPAPLAQAVGVGFLVLIMAGVHVSIGPLLTTLLFKPGKRGLRFDLFVIALLQTVALLYGIWTMYGGRPAYIVFNVDRFDVVPVQDVEAGSLARAAPAFRTSMLRPRWVGARLPEDLQKRSDLLFSSLEGGHDLPQLPEYFVPLAEEMATMLKRVHPIVELRELNPMGDAAWSDTWAGFDRAETELGYLPMRASARDGVVVLDRRTGQVLGIRILTPDFTSSVKKDLGGSEDPPPSGGARGKATL